MEGFQNPAVNRVVKLSHQAFLHMYHLNRIDQLLHLYAMARLYSK